MNNILPIFLTAKWSERPLAPLFHRFRYRKGLKLINKGKYEKAYKVIGGHVDLSKTSTDPRFMLRSQCIGLLKRYGAQKFHATYNPLKTYTEEECALLEAQAILVILTSYLKDISLDEL